MDNFLTSISFQLISLFYILIIVVRYYRTDKVSTLDNFVYTILLYYIVFILLIDITSVLAGFYCPKENINLTLCKIYLMLIVSWLLLFTYYIFCLFSKRNQGYVEIKNNKEMPYFIKIFKYFAVIMTICNLTIMALPINIYVKDFQMYTYGASVNFCYLVAAIILVSWLIIMLIGNMNRKGKLKKQNILVVTILCIMYGSAAVQYMFPQILAVSSAATFVSIILYFVVENPDMKLIEELNIATTQADKANMAKSEFLSNMSHEIRTPLNAIVGFSRALSEEKISPQAKEEVNEIIESANNLLRIVNAILDISKIDASKLEIVPVEYDSKKLFDKLIKYLKDNTEDEPIEVRTQIDSKIPPVLYGDKNRVEQVVINLLSNAIKYTKEGYVSLLVNSERKDDICTITIVVDDSGIGIAKEQLQDLFNQFQKIETDVDDRTDGAGLGLAITKKLVDLMDGTISVESIAGKGSRFKVKINQKILDKDVSEIEEQAEDVIDVFDASKAKIAVIDDNNVNLKVAKKLLKDYNVEPELILSGPELLEKVRFGTEYDIIMLDEMMPRMSGTECLAELRKIDGLKAKIIALTANQTPGIREKYIAKGFDDYLAKPIEKIQLYHIMKKYLKEQDNEEKEVS